MSMTRKVFSVALDTEKHADLLQLIDRLHNDNRLSYQKILLLSLLTFKEGYRNSDGYFQKILSLVSLLTGGEITEIERD